MKQNLWAGLVMVLFGGLLLTVLIPHGIVEPRKIKFAALSPSYYPRIVAVALLLLGLAVCVRAWLVNTAPTAEPEPHPNSFQRLAVMFAILAVFATLLPWLGFVLASSLVLLATLWLADERRLHVVLPLSLILPVALYFFFLKVAHVPIPTGILSPLLTGL